MNPAFKQLLKTIFPRSNEHLGPSFRTAVGLSLLIHVAFFVAVGALLFLFQTPAPGARTLIFEFTFVPSPTEGDALASQDSDLTEPQATPPPPPAPELPSSEAPVQPRDMEPLADSEPPEETAPLDPPAASAAEGIETANSAEPAVDRIRDDAVALAGRILTPSLEKPRPRDPPHKLVPARLTMPDRQQRVVRKKLQKTLSRHLKRVLSDTTLLWNHKGQVYTATFHYRPASSVTALDELLVDVSTERDGLKLTTQMRMRRLAFSSFAQFVDYWDPRVAIHDDELDGRFHSNTAFNVSSSRGITPKFRGKVTTAAYQVRNLDRHPFLDLESIFAAGIEMGVDVIRLPRSFAAFAAPDSSAEPRFQVFNEKVWITFHRDGTFTWRTESAPQAVQRRKLPDEPFYIFGQKKAVIRVKGVVRGKVLVYSAGKIIIDDDLVYATHPEVSPDSEDYLGLLCEKDIEIAHPRTTGPGDLHIHAAILARRRFVVRHLWTHKPGTLHIYGSLSVGSLSATEPRYATRIQFDKRLDKKRPPNFPMTDRFEIVSWDRRWQVALPDSTSQQLE